MILRKMESEEIQVDNYRAVLAQGEPFGETRRWTRMDRIR